jgi:cell division protein FtsL
MSALSPEPQQEIVFTVSDLFFRLQDGHFSANNKILSRRILCASNTLCLSIIYINEAALYWVQKQIERRQELIDKDALPRIEESTLIGWIRVHFEKSLCVLYHPAGNPHRLELI